MHNRYEDISITTVGTHVPELLLFSVLTETLRRTRTKYRFDAKLHDTSMGLTDDNKTVTRTKGEYQGKFAFIDCSLAYLSQPLYIQLTSDSMAYIGMGVANPNVILKTDVWNYNLEATDAYIFGYDSWTSPNSIRSGNKVRYEKGSIVSMTYLNGELTISCENNSTTIKNIPRNYHPCVVFFTVGNQAKIVHDYIPVITKK